jgi:hypothetical protein
MMTKSPVPGGKRTVGEDHGALSFATGVLLLLALAIGLSLVTPWA